MAWLTARDDLRGLLSDGPTDRPNWRKKVFGDTNGVNVTFKTFDYRRITDLTSAVAPLGVYVDGALASVSSDDLTIGEFVLAVAPADGSRIEASYYNQWFLDAELDTFLQQACGFLNVITTIDQVELGLQPAALQYAAYLGYQKLAIKWADHISSTYRLEDIPADRFSAVLDGYRNMAQGFLKNATSLRKDFYTRENQADAPRFANVLGGIRDIVPRR